MSRRLRALSISLSLAASVLLCAVALSCQGNQVAPGTPSPSATAGPTPYDLGSIIGIHDLDKMVEFKIVFPSYLPPAVPGRQLCLRLACRRYPGQRTAWIRDTLTWL